MAGGVGSVWEISKQNFHSLETSQTCMVTGRNQLHFVLLPVQNFSKKFIDISPLALYTC
jgi:hypothetical protein